MKEKLVWLGLVLMVVCSGLRIQIGDRLLLEQSYAFTCSGAKGDVKYYFQGLPVGIKADNNVIFVEKQRRPNDGEYSVKIRAEDSVKQADERKVLILIKKVRQNNSVTVKTSSNSTQNLIKSDQMARNQPKSVSFSSISDSTDQNQLSAKTPKNSVTNIRRVQLPLSQPATSPPAVTPDYETINKIISSLNFGEGSEILPNPPLPNNNPIQPITTAPISPATPSPTPTPTNINITPLIISTQKASTSTSKKPPPTQSQLRLATAFNRQIAATKTVANLLSILKQSTSNKNSAVQQSKIHQQFYSHNLDTHFQKNQSLSQLQLQYSQNYQDLRNTTETLKLLKNKTEQTVALIDQKSKQKEVIVRNIEYNQDRARAADQLIGILKDQKENLVSMGKVKDLECQGWDRDYGEVMDQLEGKIDEIVDVRVRLVPARREVQLTVQIIDDLKQQLSKAEKSLKQSQFVVSYYQSQQLQLNQSLLLLQQKQSQTRTKMQTCHSASTNISQQISKIQTQRLIDVQKDKINAQNSAKNMADDLSKVNVDLGALPGELGDLRGRVGKLEGVLGGLQKVLGEIQKKITVQQAEVFDANQAVIKSKQNLDAILKKIQVEQKKIDDSTIALESARVEKEKADQQVQKLLRESSSTLSYTTPDKNFETLNALVTKQMQALAQIQNGTVTQNSTAEILNQTLTQITNKNKTDIPANETQKIINTTTNPAATKPIDQKGLQVINKETKLIQNDTGPTNIAEASAPGKQLSYFVYSGLIRYLTPNRDGTYTIKNMPEFVLNIFGPRIEAPLIGNTTKLYPIKPQFDLVQMQIRVADQISVSGYAISTRLNSFGLLTDAGTVLQVSYSSVITIFSLDPQAQIAPGSKVLLRGVPKQKNTFLATLVFFLSL